MLTLDAFLTLPGEDHRIETVPDDRLVLLIDRPAQRGLRWMCLTAMERTVRAFALVGCAAAIVALFMSIADARMVLRGGAPIPWHAGRADRRIGAARRVQRRRQTGMGDRRRCSMQRRV